MLCLYHQSGKMEKYTFFSCLHVHVFSLVIGVHHRSFDVLNPTNDPYAFKWKCEDSGCSPFRCLNPCGTILPGKTVQVRMGIKILFFLPLSLNLASFIQFNNSVSLFLFRPHRSLHFNLYIFFSFVCLLSDSVWNNCLHCSSDVCFDFPAVH